MCLYKLLCFERSWYIKVVVSNSASSSRRCVLYSYLGYLSLRSDVEMIGELSLAENLFLFSRNWVAITSLHVFCLVILINYTISVSVFRWWYKDKEEDLCATCGGQEWPHAHVPYLKYWWSNCKLNEYFRTSSSRCWWKWTRRWYIVVRYVINLCLFCIIQTRTKEVERKWIWHI